jgi:hypothetical protein
VSSQVEEGSRLVTIEARHRDYPEVRATGRTARDAVLRLVKLMDCMLEGATDSWPGCDLRRARGEVWAFAQSAESSERAPIWLAPS